jgi:predicted Zn finger-like uncharacterized protein
MKVTCQSCQAKYTIADEKVRGKVAKIRCKKCGTTIIVNGTDAAAGAVADYTQQSSVDEQWSVLVAEGDQRAVTSAQLSELYAGGTITFETPAWKDGMVDWLPISQIDALRSILEHGPRPTMTPDPGMALASLLPDAPGGPLALPSPAEPAAAKPAGPAARINAPEPAARRRPRGGSTDLFGAAVQDDVMTSASGDPSGQLSSGADRPTGARNENSVLFSLAALTGGSAPTPSKPSARTDKEPPSGKADLRALMSGTDNRPAAAKSKLDDIINLSGGGVYSPGMMTAPILAPPPVEFSATADAVGGAIKPKGKGSVAILIGAIVIVAVAAVAFTTISSKAESEKALAAASASAKVAAEALSAALASAEAMKVAAQTPEPTAAPEAPAQAATVIAPGQSAPKGESDKEKDKEKKVIVAKVDRSEKEKPSAPPGAAALGVAPPAPAAPAPPAAAGGGSGDFDRAAALSTLSSAATAAQSCRRPDGPTGSGRIAVTFANSGQATTANVEGPPFAGTPVGGCVAARFRGTHVPPFGGAPITVHKTFNIN